MFPLSSLSLGRFRLRPSLPLLSALLGVASAGCAPSVARPVAAAAPAYAEPPPTAPHAMVVVSASYLVEPGPQLEMDGSVEGQAVLRSASTKPPPVSVRVKPGGTAWHFASRFFHREWQSHEESVSRLEREYDSCASHDSRGNCQGGTRSVVKWGYETVTRLVDVDDARCLEDAAYNLDPGRSYRIAYLFRGNQQCASTCLDVTDDAVGTACAKAVILPKSVAAPAKTVAEPAHGVLHGPGTALVVLGAMGLLAGTAGLAYAFEKKQELDGHCDTNRVCDSEGLAATQQGKTAGTVATVGFGAGTAVLATGIAFLVFGPSAKSPATLAPTQGGAQLTFQGSF